MEVMHPQGKGHPRLPENSPKAWNHREKHWTNLPSEGTNQCWHLDLELKSPELWDDNFCCCSEPPNSCYFALEDMGKIAQLPFSIEEMEALEDVNDRAQAWEWDCLVQKCSGFSKSHSPPSSLSFSGAFLLPGSAHSTLLGNTSHPSPAGTPEMPFVCRSWREDIWVSVLLVLLRAT